jgi:hypothetical protein
VEPRPNPDTPRTAEPPRSDRPVREANPEERKAGRGERRLDKSEKKDDKKDK